MNYETSALSSVPRVGTLTLNSAGCLGLEGDQNPFTDRSGGQCRCNRSTLGVAELSDLGDHPQIHQQPKDQPRARLRSDAY